jgi:hypothetical protein
VTVTLYCFEDADGCPSDYTTFNAQEAQDHARRWGLLCLAREFEYSDTDVAWDFRPSTVEGRG